MARQIDTELFTTTTGGLDILAVVGKVFLLQLDPWRKAVRQHSDCFDASKLLGLVHRMKGSCLVVAATGAAAELQQAEGALQHLTAAQWAPTSLRLLSRLQQVESELQELIRCGADPSP